MNKNKLINHNNDCIKNKIYVIRGQQAMLDVDLAEIYGYEVKRLNEQVKRNIDRFPEDFMFQLTTKDLENLWSQNATTNVSPMTRTMPYAFTEQGIYMLATVLKGELARQQSIFIMRTFKSMRHYLAQNKQIVTRSEIELVTSKVMELDKDNKEIKKSIEELSENFINKDELKNIVIYDNQKFEADIAYTKIYKRAKKSIYVIDDYVSIETLQLLSHKKSNVEVILFTDNKKGYKGNCLTSKEVNDFNNEYPTLKIKSNNKCHDRYIVLDYKTKQEEIYHCGASSKDAGNKLCSINKITDKELMRNVVESLMKNKEIILY